MKITEPSDLLFEKATIEKTRSVAEEMLQDLQGLELLNHAHARLEAEIADVRLALETISKARAELWKKLNQDLDRTRSFSAVGTI